MSTITLYSGRVNQMPSLILALKRSVGYFGEDIETLRQSALGIDSSICSLDETISSLRASSDTQEAKAAVLDTIQTQTETFISETASIDVSAAEAISTSEEDFYSLYDYLRPAEDSIWDAIGDFFGGIGEGLAELFSGAWDVLAGLCNSLSQWCRDNAGLILLGCKALVAIAEKIGDVIVVMAPWLPAALDLLKEGASLFYENILAPLGTLIMNSPLGPLIEDAACKFISFMGQMINTEWFGDIVEGVITLFGPFIEIGKIWTKGRLPGADFVVGLIGAKYDERDGVYHIDQGTWQGWGPVGYNDGYDNVFNRGVGATKNSIGVYKSQEFTVDGNTFIIWAWKGDYMNLGAGAETGIYMATDDGFHYETATEYACDMELMLEYNGEQLFDYAPYGDEAMWHDGAQWWVNGFDPQHQNVQARDLTSTTTIDFNTMENGREMFYALEQSVESGGSAQGGTWTFDDSNGQLIATLEW